MLLREMFSPIGAPNGDEQEIDWIDDLKFFIDNNDDILSKNFFPVIKKHKDYVGNPNVFKLYMKPIERCKDSYVQRFEIDNPEEIFTKEKIIELAKIIATEQEKHIKSGSYK